MRFFRFPTAMVRPLSSLAKFSFVISNIPFPQFSSPPTTIAAQNAIAVLRVDDVDRKIIARTPYPAELKRRVYSPIGLRGAVSINRRNLHLLREDDCGGSVGHDAPNPVRRGKSRPVASAQLVGALLVLHLRLKSPSTINWRQLRWSYCSRDDALRRFDFLCVTCGTDHSRKTGAMAVFAPSAIRIWTTQFRDDECAA
jgi:hypothetical protein